MELLSAGVFLSIVFAAAQGISAEYGRVSGKVTDASGKPLMGATVLLTGSATGSASGLLAGSIDRVFTDAHGNFTISRVTPGWYSLQVLSPARLPAFRNNVEVKPGATTREAFALGEILSGIRWQPSSQNTHAWAHEWKWILRTSASTRPILRYNKKSEHAHNRAARKGTLPSRHLIAMMPETVGANGLSEDPGMDTVVAYLHPLDKESDVLVAGSVSKNGLDGSSMVADYRRGIYKKDNQEISLAVHQLTLDGNGIPIAVAGHGEAVSRGMVLRYIQTRQLSNALTLTAGFEMRYLDSLSDASTANPEIDLAYQVNPSTVLDMSYGTGSADQPGSLLGRIGDLNAFPMITLHESHPRLENVRHAEIRVERAFGPKSGIEIAAYHDGFQNVAVWGLNGIQTLQDPSSTGNVLISPTGDRAILDAGNFGSSGAEVTYQRNLGHRTEVGVMYAFGGALAVRHSTGSSQTVAFDPASLSESLRKELTQTISGKFSTVIPHLKTRVITTYSWLPAGRITIVDPYGQTRMDFQPFWGLQIRQPLPRIDMLPLQIVAIADFRNLLGQGSVSLPEVNGGSVVLTPAYRTVRGGFAVQF